MPCLSPVVTDFPEISRKFEGLRLELVSRNFALVQQKPGPKPNRDRLNSRKNSRKPGVDRSPRPTQKRPPPANPTLPPPAPSRAYR